jgi:hypothetical protein
MNINQAIELLNNATAQLQLNRVDHVKIQMAIEVIRKFVDNHMTAEKPIDKPADVPVK